MKRLLVIGGTGFVGSHLCRVAGESGYSITSLSLNPAGRPIHGVQYRNADLGDAGAVKGALGDGRFEYVVNCGGYIDHRLFRDGGRALIQRHFDGLQNVIECLDRGCLIRFVQLGSSDEYGSARAPQREDMREAPIAPYSLAKVAASHFLQMLWRTEKFPAVTLRLFLTYGPGQDARRFIPQLVRGCLAGGRFPVSGGAQLRDFCYVGDVTQGILRAFDVGAACGEVINLASGAPVTIRAVIEQVRALIGRGEPEFGRIPYRPGENKELYADISRAKSILGWSPRTDLATGLRRTVEFYEEKRSA